MERPLLVSTLIEEAIDHYGHATYSKEGLADPSALIISPRGDRLACLPSFGTYVEGDGEDRVIYYSDPGKIARNIEKARAAVAKLYGVSLAEDETVPVIKKKRPRPLDPGLALTYINAHNTALRATQAFIKQRGIWRYGLATAGSAAEGLVEPYQSDADMIVCLEDNDLLAFIDDIETQCGLVKLTDQYREFCERFDRGNSLPYLFSSIHLFIVSGEDIGSHPYEWVAGSQYCPLSLTVRYRI